MRDPLNFLNPHPIQGKAAVLHAESGEVEIVDHIPDWYWDHETRVIAFSDVNLVGHVQLATYFTCEVASDGTAFATVYSTRESPEEWLEVARSQTPEEAKLKHAAIRAAWQRQPQVQSGAQPFNVPTLPGSEE